MSARSWLEQDGDCAAGDGAEGARAVRRFLDTHASYPLADGGSEVPHDSPAEVDEYRLVADTALHEVVRAPDGPRAKEMSDAQVLACESLYRARGTAELPRLGLALAVAAHERLIAGAGPDALELAHEGIRCLNDASTRGPEPSQPSLVLCLEAAAQVEMTLEDHGAAAAHLDRALIMLDCMLEKDEGLRPHRLMLRRRLTTARAAQVRASGMRPRPLHDERPTNGSRATHLVVDAGSDHIAGAGHLMAPPLTDAEPS